MYRAGGGPDQFALQRGPLPQLAPDSLFFPTDNRLPLSALTKSAPRRPSTAASVTAHHNQQQQQAVSPTSPAVSNASASSSMIKDPAFRAIVASLDITRITDRVVACGLPWSKPSVQKSHRNNLNDLALFLRTRYKERYMIWNLTDNVCVVHCTNGIVRTGIAVAAYLRYSDTFADALTAFDYFIARRTPNDNSWPTVSQRRYLTYFNNTILVAGVLPTKVPLALDSIIMNGIPDFDENEGSGCRPGIEVYMNRKLVWSLVHSRHTKHPPIIIDRIGDTIEFHFGDVSGSTDGLILDRDIQIRIFHCADPDEPTQNIASQQVVTMVNFSFNTGFMPAGLIRVCARDLDLNRSDVDDGRFVAGFSLDFSFEEALQRVAVGKDDKGYSKFLDRSLNKCLARLISYHVVKVDENLMKGLEKMGISRLLACIALQKTNNDWKQACEFYKSTLAPAPAIPPPPPPQSSRTLSPSELQPRRAAPTAADLRLHTRQNYTHLSPHRDRERSPALARSASTEGSIDRIGNGGVRGSIQRLEGLIQKSAEAAAASATPVFGSPRRNAPPTRRSSRSASASSTGREEDQAVVDLVRELRERRERAAAAATAAAAAAPAAVASKAASYDAVPVQPLARSEVVSTVESTQSTIVASAGHSTTDEADAFDYLDMYESLPDDATVVTPTAIADTGYTPRQASSSSNASASRQKSETAPPVKLPEPEYIPLEEPSEERVPVLTKMRESATTRKSVLKKRQTLIWRDVEAESDAPTGVVEETKKAIGKDGKPVEVKKFEELFCFVPAESKSGSGPKLVQKAQFTTLLDIRRANVIAIGMSRFTRRNMTGALLAASLSIEDLIQLKQLVPTESDARILNQYHNTPRMANDLPLAPAEFFMMDLIKTERDIGTHVDAFLFIQQLPVEIADISELLDNMSSMCTQFQTSSDLKVVLRTVYQLQQMSNDDLGAGNASFRPWMGKEAKMIGFRIDGLARLKDVKSADGNWSLMNLLVDLVNKNRPDVLDFTTKFHALKKIRQYDLRQLVAQLIQMEATLKNIRGYQYKNTSFALKLRPFLDNAATELAALRARFDLFQKAWNDAAEYFAEESDEYVLLPELFEIVARNPDPNYNTKLSQVQQGNGTSVPETPFGNRKQLTHLFVTMHVFLFGFEDSVKQNRRKVEEEARRLVKEAAAAEERRRREEARAIKEGRMAPPPPAPYENPLLSSWKEDMAFEGGATSIKPSNAVRNRASVMLLQKKEVEAREMLARFSMIQKTGITDDELQIRAQNMEEGGDETDFESGSQISQTRGGDEENGPGYESGEYSENGRRDSFQSVVSTFAASTVGRDQGNLCHECFMPLSECYCNW
ncbi:Tensin-3 [Entophlyctis luteolus]|nr:Tensin-3 [Entophlyctis luteolus]